VAGGPHIQRHPGAEHDVRFRDELGGSRRGEAARDPERPRVAGEQPVGNRGCCEQTTQQVGQLLERCASAGNPGPAASDDQLARPVPLQLGEQDKAHAEPELHEEAAAEPAGESVEEIKVPDIGSTGSANVIEVLVGRLRRKLEANCQMQPIETVRGRGYLFTERCQ
jgi:hypothetical protein